MADDPQPRLPPPALQPADFRLPVFLVRGGDRFPVDEGIGRQF